MFGSLRGVAVAPQVVEVSGGIGFRVHTLRPLDPGAEVFLWVHTVERETGTSLYGFADPAELETFEELVKTAGVGPALALSMLGALGVPGLAAAVQAQDASALATVPGVGPKKAATLAATLRLPEHLLAGASPVGHDGLADDLRAMGFAPGDVAAALETARGEMSEADPGSDPVLFAALRVLRSSALEGKVSDGL